MKICITFLKGHNNKQKKQVFNCNRHSEKNFERRNIDFFYLFVFHFHFHPVSTLKADSSSLTHSPTVKLL